MVTSGNEFRVGCAKEVIMSFKLKTSWTIMVCLLLTMLSVSPAVPAQAGSKAVVSELDVSGRKMEVWSWPAEGQSRGIILFSHGAASAPWKYESLISDWVAARYDVYAPLHVDSTDHPLRESYQGMASWKARLEDVDRLAEEFGDKDYIMAGHSYGALVALTKGGARAAVPEGYDHSMTDGRIRLVIAFSPPAAIPGFIDKEAYEGLAVPALIQTGTMDNPPGGNVDWHGHLDAYEMAQAGGHRYALVIEGVDHYFGGAICRPELPGPKLEGELEIAAQISILMMNAFYGSDTDALNQLQSRLSPSGPVVLETK